MDGRNMWYACRYTVSEVVGGGGGFVNHSCNTPAHNDKGKSDSPAVCTTSGVM